MVYLCFKNLIIGYILLKDWICKVYMDKVCVYFSVNNICEFINKSNVFVDLEVNIFEVIVNGGSSDYGNGIWGWVDLMYCIVLFGL